MLVEGLADFIQQRCLFEPFDVVHDRGLLSKKNDG
jgi:hypothetical protein